MTWELQRSSIEIEIALDLVVSACHGKDLNISTIFGGVYGRDMIKIWIS